jgi:hypothetical protein
VNEPAGKLLSSCRVVAYGWAELPLAGVEAARARLASEGSPPVPLKHVKNSDEQTIAGLAALFQALHAAGWEGRAFRDWGVVGAPRFLGRMALNATIKNYLSNPGYSVSPHIIPNQSLHALASTVSLALSLQGPNFGVGGGPGHVAEGLLAGLSAVNGSPLPGVWLIIAQFDPEPIPDPLGKATNAIIAKAVALALQSGQGPSLLRLLPQVTRSATISLADLQSFVADPTRRGQTWRCPVDGLGTLELILN